MRMFLDTWAIGLDIGGTSTVAAVVAGNDASVLARDTMLTEASRGPEDGLQRIAVLIERVLDQAGLGITRVAGIGVGCTGPVDTLTGRVQNPYTLPTWNDVPLIDFLTTRYGRPSILLNDCGVAALGEHWAGAGRNARYMLYITVGTGIGGGIIINGQLYRGVGLMAGEIGHHVIKDDGPPCYCGARGCWEMLAAAPAIVRAAVEQAVEGSLLMQMADHDRSRLTAQIVAQAAEQGDPVAVAIMHRTAYYLGVGVANLMNILAPEVVVMGGGVMQSWHLIEPVLLETVRQRGAMVPFKQIRIQPAALQLNAGVIGAARAILEHVRGGLQP